MKRLLSCLLSLALFASVALGQCGPNGCPSQGSAQSFQPFSGIQSQLRQSQQFKDPNGGGTFDPVKSEFSSACQINGASGSLVAKGPDWGAIWTCAHGDLPESTDVAFPLTKERFKAKRIAFDKQTDVAVYVTVGRPLALLVKLSSRLPREGEEIAYGGFGPAQKWQAFRGKYLGTVGSRDTNRGKMEDGVRWKGSCRPGDSGGPVWIPGEGQFSLVTGSANGESIGPNVEQLCQLIDENRTLFPWNADTLREQSRNESEAAREAQRTEQERLRAMSQAGGVDAATRDEIARMSASLGALVQRVDDLEGRVDTGRDLVKDLGLWDNEKGAVLQDRVGELKAEFDKAIGKVEDAEAKAAAAVAVAADATNKAEVAGGVVEKLEGGIGDRIKQHLLTLLPSALMGNPMMLGILAAVAGLGFMVIRKDFKDRKETGDPLIVEKLLGAVANKTSNTVDDRVVDKLADVLDRLAPRPAKK